MENKKQILFGLLILFFGYKINAQEILEGSISYANTANVYVRFESTKHFKVGDTLMSYLNGQWLPSFVIKKLSSISCVTQAIDARPHKVGDRVAFFKIVVPKVEPQENIKTTPPIQISHVVPSVHDTIDDMDNRKQSYSARFTASTNASIADGENNYQRIRTALTFNITHIKGSPLSLQSYLTYRHRYGIDQTQTNFFDDFKVYTLFAQYTIDKKSSVSMGRKIISHIANMGAIDGIQYERNVGILTMGVFGGSRPDILNYTFNANLLQAGGYIAHHRPKTQTSIAFAEQTNNNHTDRRFLYFQHSNSLVKNINFFYSVEMDLYQNIDSVITNNINLTSTYFSVRVKPFRPLSINVSYDNRRNVIFYESNRLYIDQLLNQATRQGIRAMANYNLTKHISINGSVFYRYQNTNESPTKNYTAAIQFPLMQSSVNINANLLETYQLKGQIFGGRISRNFLASKLYMELNFRNVYYQFNNSEQSLKQDIVGLTSTIQLSKASSFSLSYEGTFDVLKDYHRYFITYMHKIKG